MLKKRTRNFLVSGFYVIFVNMKGKIILQQKHGALYVTTLFIISMMITFKLAHLCSIWLSDYLSAIGILLSIVIGLLSMKGINYFVHF